MMASAHAGRIAHARRVLVAHLPEAYQRFVLAHRACLGACAMVCQYRTAAGWYKGTARADWIAWVLLHVDLIPRDADGCVVSLESADAYRDAVPWSRVSAAIRRWDRARARKQKGGGRCRRPGSHDR